MSQTWSILTAVIVLAVQLCTGDKSCAIWSSAGLVVQRGSSFEVYCTFQDKCKGCMYGDHPPKEQRHKELNSTTIYLNVVNITENRTYSCSCSCRLTRDPCGLDISAGYPPDRPENISCIYKVTNNESGDVHCTWNRGRNTYLWNSSVLRVTTVFGNRTVGLMTHKVSGKGNGFLKASFTMASSVQMISVCIQAKNKLGSAESVNINYTLSEIAEPLPPELGQPECSSRECAIRVKQPMRTQHLEIQYRTGEQTWTSYHPNSSEQTSLAQVWSISALEPYRLYHFRARSKFSTGLWSEWSRNVSILTQEETPATELDVWFAEATADLKSLKVYWKELNISNARGNITGYEVNVYSQNSLVSSANISVNDRSHLVQFCTNCEVTVRAFNSKGLSPPARITAHHKTVEPLSLARAPAGNHSVAISWRKPETAPQHAAYVVEWYPHGHKLEELRWVRLGRNEHQANITDISPFECYDGAVYVVHNEGSVSRTGFKGVTTFESAPSGCPSFQEEVDESEVKVTWSEIPRHQRRGCITNYTIYLDVSGHKRLYFVPASKRSHIIKDLSPAHYRLWMTAWTAQGECREPQKVKVVIQQDTQLTLGGVCALIAIITVIPLFLCQIPAVKRRFWVFFQCLMLDVVPDPANSKWAKECTQEKGKINLQLQQNNSSVTEEEEPILVDVEELPNQSSDFPAPADVSSQLPPQTSLSPLTEPATLSYPLTTYIKSFSHDSDSSDHTQTSLDTNTTVDYISSHGLGNMDEEDQEDDDEEEEFANVLGFFPSHGITIDPLMFGGKLTLDAVKIDCNDFFQNNNF